MGAAPHVQSIVSAEDVSEGKPDPQVYRLGRQRMEAALGRPLRPGDCLAIEDAPAGVAAAKAAGMKVLAVSNSVPPAGLAQADRVVPSLAGMTIERLKAIVG